MASKTFSKNKIVEIVEFLTQFKYELVYYKFEKVENDLYKVNFFGLHPDDRESLELAINVNFC